MNVILDKIKMAMRAKLMPYAGLLDYRYKNLCVKTSTEALLPVEVHVDTTDLPLEQVAKPGIIDDEHFQIIPNNAELLPLICQAFLETHPQLKQEVFDPLDNPYVSEETKLKVRHQKELVREQTGEELILPGILILTTPEVDDEAKKMLNDTVDVLKKQCDVLFKKEYAKFKTELNSKMAESMPEELVNANKELDNEYQNLWKDVETYTMEERQTIEEANMRYHERKSQMEQAQNNGYTNVDANVTQSMKIGEFEE